MTYTDTVFALSSASGKAGLAVIRVSGTQAQNVFQKMVPIPVPSANFMQYTCFYDPETQDTLDFGLCVFFAAPKSFTGEDCVEFHIHGGLATLQSMLLALGKIPNFRLAEAGEFSKRGFLNGKFDLTQAESLIDLIDAETEHQRRAALSHTRGALHQLYQDWWHRLSQIRAYSEACLDFPDEEIPDDLEDHICTYCETLRTEIAQHHETAPKGERLRLGTKIAIVGPSNAGKSSLMNYLAQTQAAITSPIAGTTRDSIELHIDIAGYPVKLIDTAGVQKTSDPIEQEGIKRARQHAEQADLILIMFDGSQPILDYNEFVQLAHERPCIIISNKSDQDFSDRNNNIITKFPMPLIYISLTEPSGLTELHETIAKNLENLAGGSHAPIIMHARYQQALHGTLKALDRVDSLIKIAQASKTSADLVLIAEELRIGLNHVAQIIGKVDVEDLLEIIFSRFCIGK